MPDSYSARRMLLTLPGLYKVTSFPKVDYTFFGAEEACLFRPYLWDDANRLFSTDGGRTINLPRAADSFVTADDGQAIYGGAIRADPATGEVANLGFDVDADLGTSFTLTFVIHPLWDTQPTAASAFYPFRHTGTNNPRVGYVENTGTVEAAGWRGFTSGTQQSLTYALGWKPRQLLAVSLVTDRAAGTTKLYVNGVERASISQAVTANVAGTMRINRPSTQSGTTGSTNIEAYFAHNVALSASQIATLHSYFTTGLTTESRIVRLFTAIALATGQIEDLGWKHDRNRQVRNATGGSLLNLGRDISIERKAGESDTALRKRIRNRYLEIFSEGTPNQLIQVAAGATDLLAEDIVLNLNQDSSGNDAHAALTVLLPVGQDAKLTDLDNAIKAAKTAGIKHYTGVQGSFAWDVDDKGWGAGAWEFVR